MSLDRVIEGYRRFCFEGDDDEEAHLAFFTLDDLSKSNPELCWLAIERLIEGATATSQLLALGAGPLEELLRAHGELFIDRLARAAAANPAYARAATAIYAHAVSGDVRAKVEALKLQGSRTDGAA